MCLNPGDIVGGRYEIIQRLGRGGFGTTYTAYDNRQTGNLDVLVVKQIRLAPVHAEAERDPDYIDRLELEANTLRNLNHPCIPRFLNSFSEDEYFYIVQEHIEGHNLAQEICPGSPVQETQAVGILTEILEILQFVHNNNVIHRDVKPANIIRRHRDNRLFLIDFGAVKEIATEHTNASGITLTRIIQSIGYTPAEQIAGYPRLNSDIFALGITLMRAVTGFSVDAIHNSNGLPSRDSYCNYVWEDYAPHINSQLREIISKMIKYDFRDRYQCVDEALEALAEYSRSTDIVSDRESEDYSQNNEAETQSIDIPTQSSSNQVHASNRQIIKFVVQAAIGCCLAFLIYFVGKTFLSPISNSCTLQLADNISCGEEILDPLSHGAIRFRAAEKYYEQEYSEALKYFQESWQKERRDAETLIYLNNSLLDANDIEAPTIALAVPFNSDKIIKSSSTVQDFLRGVAQAQTEVNLSLSNSNQAVAAGLSQYSFLPHRSINQNGNNGLKVVIVDDANNKEQAKETAHQIVKNKAILGIVGHYTSSMTLNTVDIYEQNDLAGISYGTTTMELSENPKSNFFRVVYTNEEEAEALVKYIEQYDVPEKRIAIFYNPKSEYSNRFKIEIETKIENLARSNINIVEEFNFADEENFSVASAMNKLDRQGINICMLLPDGQISNSLAKAIEVIDEDGGERLMLAGNPLINPKVNQIEADRRLNLIVATFWHPTVDPESKFNRLSSELWETEINGGTAMAYDATLAMVEALKQQKNPTRKGTIAQLRDENFSVAKAATGEVYFNTPKNGDRQDFYPTLVRLFKCKDTNHFVSLSHDNIQAKKSACETEEEM